MKASELMVNDLVRTNKDEIIKVESISTKRQHRKVGYHKPADITHIKYVRQGQLEPIPLTAIMLANNGMREDKWDEGDIQRCGGIAYREFHANEKFFYVRGHGENPVEWKVYNNGQVTVKYVHEFQHALRLCGLNELADNFKI